MKSAMAIVSLAILSASVAQAQGVPNPFSGMGRDSDAPITIAADSTTADIKNETATYAGNVRVDQGNLKLRSDTLAIKASKGTIEHIEAKGNVVLASPQGNASGSTAVYDISQRVVKLGGQVVLVNGPNILKGTSLVVNLATGRAELSGGGPDGRVSGVFVPAKTPKAGGPTGTAPSSQSDKDSKTTP